MNEIKILFGLDDLYDTRMSTMLSLNAKKAINLITRTYGRRRGDWVIWEGMGMSEGNWRKVYKQRDAKILTKSVRSKLTNLLHEFIVDAEKGPKVSAGRSNVKFIINEYPYRLDSKVQKKIGDTIKSMLSPVIEVDWIRKSPKLLTPDDVNQNYTHYINYDMIEWLALHIENPSTGNLLQTQLIAPRLFQEKPEVEDFSTYKGVIDEVHSFAECHIAPSMKMSFVNVEYFNTPY